MNFQRGRTREEPEINLIPMIDVLLVILIFMMVTTSYAKFSELKIDLPQAEGVGSTIAPPAKMIRVAVDASQHYSVDNQPLTNTELESLVAALKGAAGNQTNPTINIDADAKATHQSVINVMQAAQNAGYTSVTFTTQNQPK